MKDKQQVTKVYPQGSQLNFICEEEEKCFYLLYYEENTLAIERCSIKNIQKSFETSLAK